MTTILLVEDETLIAMSLAEALAEAGFTVRCEFEGRRALDAAAQTEFGAAVVDLGLPDMSGTEVARELRARYPALPIIVCTAFFSQDLARFVEETRVQFLEKPVEDSQLVSTLQGLLGGFGRRPLA